jgi:uncharacterized protein YndB with AHSA1/START domain
MRTSINHTVFYPHPPQDVWEYLTKPELMQQWLMKTDFLPVIGHDFQFNTRPIPDLKFDGVVYCKVLEIVPNKKLRYSWKTGPGNGQITIDSIVTWILKPRDNGTELILEHTGVREMEDFNMYKAMSEGWKGNMEKIGKLMAVN